MSAHSDLRMTGLSEGGHSLVAEVLSFALMAGRTTKRRHGTLDDLNGEVVEMRDGGLQLLSSVAAIGEEAGRRGTGIPASIDKIG